MGKNKMELKTRIEGMFMLTEEDRNVVADVVFSQAQVETDAALSGVRARQCPGLKGVIREALLANDEALLEELTIVAQNQAMDGLYRRLSVWKLRYNR